VTIREPIKILQIRDHNARTKTKRGCGVVVVNKKIFRTNFNNFDASFFPHPHPHPPLILPSFAANLHTLRPF